MRICVIGGSGFIGTHLVKKVKKNHQIKIIDKAPSSAFPELVIKGDIRDREFLNQYLKGYDLIIHLAAEHKDNVTPQSIYYDVNVQGTQNILDAMDQNGIKNIIFTSTVAIYGLNKINPNETHPPDPFNHYGKSKWQAEELLREWHNSSNQKSISIVRPTVIFGEDNRGNVYSLLKQIATGKFIMVGDGQNKKSMAYVGNVVSFIEYLLNNMNGYQDFNYADKPDLSTRELIQTIESLLSANVPSIRIPYWLGLTGGYLSDIVSKVVAYKEFPISSVRVKKFCATTQFDAKKVHNSKFEAPYSLSEGLDKTLKYEFQKNGF